MTETLIEPRESQETEKAPKSQPREYLVFEEKQNDVWAKVGSVEATSAESAIRKTASRNPGRQEGVRFAAVPARNWTAGRPKIETHTTITVDFE